MLRSQLDLKDNRIKELEAELAMVRGGKADDVECSTALLGFYSLISLESDIWEDF